MGGKIEPTTKKDPFIEALKAMARLAIFAGVSAIITVFLSELAKIEDKNAYVLILTLIFQFLDKWIHEHKDGILADVNGLLPF